MRYQITKKSASSAFLAMKDGLAVTAWHVVDRAVKVTAKFSDAKVVDVLGVVDKDQEKEIALIKLNFAAVLRDD